MRIVYPAVGVLLVALAAGAGAGAGARTPAPLPDFSLQRSLFVLAERTLPAMDEAAAATARKALAGYPLFPYLEYGLLARNTATASPDAVAAFLELHADTPLAGLLRTAYLEELAGQKRWRDYLRFAGDGTGLSTELRCFRMQALLHTGARREALSGVEAIWLHGRSQPKACDPALDAWREAGMLTVDLAWQRFELAVDENQTGLARYLRRYLSTGDRVWADRWLELEANPERVTRAGFRPEDHRAAGLMLERAFLRLIRRDLDAARDAWRSHGSRIGLEPEQRQRIQHALALRLAVRGSADALPFMAGLPDAVFDDPLRQWQLRAALRARDWSTVLVAVDGMSDDTRSEAPWQYWRARALENAGHTREALDAYRNAAQHRNFHGFLAADRVGLPYRIGHEPVVVPGELAARVSRLPAMLRMRELVLLARYPEARREWSHMIGGLSTGEQEAAARLFADWGWHDRAIFTAARARSWADIELRFPLAFAELIVAGADRQDIDPAWALAVARQESAFLHDARSSAGALGIMQIMPATGRTIARAAGVRIAGDRDILDPENNARMGTYYLRRNLDGFHGHSLLSTAAYNAGAQRVRSWLPDSGAVDPDIWAELIPFQETRDYVQRVFAYRVIYAVRLGKAPPSLDSLLFPVTPSDSLAQARERHLAGLGLSGRELVATRSFCDAPGYTSARCL